VRRRRYTAAAMKTRPLVPSRLQRRRLLLLATASLFGGCAALTGVEPLRVSLAGVEMLAGEGLELRFMLRLRVQNPGDRNLEFDGLALDLDLRGQPFASGVSNQRGTLPRFSETVLGLPLSVPASALLRQGLSLLRGAGAPSRIPYAARGRLGGGPFGGLRFESQGEIDWPPAPAGAPPSPPSPPGTRS
jgi:hypothetical protein